MYEKDSTRVKDTGEVFTPSSLIREMLDRLPNAVWFDPTKRWLEPAAGDGNFLVEVKARLMQAGHTEIHILENMLFSIELIDDNHWALQHRLKYLIDGTPNPALNPAHFTISKISKLTQDLNDKNPYVSIGCARDEVLHHRNHVCTSGLEYDMSFGRTDAQVLYDDAFNSIFNQEFYEVEITEDRLLDAAERASIFSDRPGQPRTEEKKLADALMELAEIPFKNIGAAVGKYDDAQAFGSMTFGKLEVKSLEFGGDCTKIESKQSYRFMVIVERESTKTLASKMLNGGVDSIVGIKLKFYPKYVLEWTGKEKRLVFKKVKAKDLGPWPETDTPDVGERYVVEKMLGKQPQPQEEPKKIQKEVQTKILKDAPSNDALILKLVGARWDPSKKHMINRALVLSPVREDLKKALKLKTISSELQAKIKAVVDSYAP